MTVTPLIFLVELTGIAQVGDMRAVGRVGLKAVVYFEANTIGNAVAAVVVAKWDGEFDPKAWDDSIAQALTAK